MRQIIVVNEEKCVGCNSCVRACPVNANITKIREGSDESFYTTVDPTACISCGECVKACKHGARDYEDDSAEFEKALEKKEPIAVIVGPSIRASFPKHKWRILLSWLRAQGNVKIYDVGFGADICTFMHSKYLKAHPEAKLMSQPCPAIVNYVEMYKPELLKNLSPVLSPAGCMAAYLRKYKRVNDSMFMLSPCIAKTAEADREKLFDYNVTYRRLEELANRKGIRWDGPTSFEFDDATEGSIGRLYPMPGGLKDTMLMLDPNLIIRTAEGPNTVYDRIERYYQTEDKRKPDLLDVLNCEYGCNQGTATAEMVANLMETENMMDAIAAQSIQETQGSGLLGLGKMKRFKEFDKTLKLDDFLTRYADKRVSFVAPTVADYNKIFESMMKFDEDSQHIDCTACGYKSCHDMACAIYRGMNVRENCVNYLKASLKQHYAEIQKANDKMQEANDKMQEVYDRMSEVNETLLDDVSQINAICAEMKEGQNNIVNASSDIGTKAAELSGNIQRLQKFSQSCLNYYKDKKADSLTAEDFAKMQQFVAAIGTMTQGYYEVAKEFEENSTGIRDQISTLSEAIDGLLEMSAAMQATASESQGGDDADYRDITEVVDIETGGNADEAMLDMIK